MIEFERKAVSVSEAAKIVGLSHTQVYNLIRAGKFPSKRVGKRLLVPIAAIDKWLMEGGEV